MSRELVDATLERLRIAYGARTLRDLALRLEMDETTFRVWQSRGKVPSRVLADASAETGRPVGWLIDGVSDELGPGIAEPTGSVFFESIAKQVNLSAEELALLENYRASSAAGRLALEAASIALAKQGIKERKAA